jgi:two-component system chemotaxis response regulator CheY
MALRDQLRVLVVDDMATSRGLITQALDALGISNVATASDGRSALSSLAASPVHLVISDYNMPEMDGLQLLQTLRANPATQRTGFLLITGRADASVIDRGRALGMNNYIKKPFTPDDMKGAIEAVFGRL